MKCDLLLSNEIDRQNTQALLSVIQRYKKSQSSDR